uniref:Integrase zinc-binding domain-containing protein n=1 Tax=Tanacetum cinerariifolium TaxID=118510 RepID=A0A6L2KK92_TANCI|nr:hypothetical protein [Tanacetum cinerariifolium]
MADVQKYIWDDPYLLKSCPDGIVRRCVFGKESQEILKHFHTGATGGHYGADITARKVFESRSYWPTIFKDFATYVRECDACQKVGTISSRNQMPMTNILVSEVFDIWGIDFMGPFPSSRKNKYILRAVDDVSKWVEAEALPTSDAQVVRFLWRLLSRFGIQKSLISVHGTHFYKLDNTLWTFMTAYKAPIGSTPFRIVYGKACHLPLEMEHKAYWALKEIKLDLDAVGKHRFLQLNQLDELRTEAYEHSRAYKERTKRWHDSKIMDKEFREGEEVLDFNSRLKLFPGKLRTRWYGPYTVSKVYPYGTVKVICKYVTRNTRKGRKNKENADSYEGYGVTPTIVLCRSVFMARHVTQQDYGVTTWKYNFSFYFWCMSTHSSARNLFPPLDNPELTIQRRSRANPTLLNDFEMATEGNGDPPVLDLRTMEELRQPSLNG